MPRDLTYNPFTCDLVISASSNDIYRLNLEEGKFMSPFVSGSENVNCLEYNNYLNILLSGG
jgi:ribosome biogenesis protein ENP2